MRSFFGGQKQDKKEDPKANKEEKTEKSEMKNEEEEKVEEAAVEDKGETKEDKKAKSTTASKSDTEEDSDLELSGEDVKAIQKLIKEQDEKIDKQKTKIESLAEELKKTKQKVVYQMAENDNTVKRYRKQIEDGKTFAISKFAKDLLEIHDNIGLALSHVDMEKVKEMEDIELLKTQFENFVNGQKMTSEVMNKVLSRFDVVQNDPMGDVFDPNIHDA